MSEGSGYGNGVLCDGVEDLLNKTVGIWQPSPLWIFRGKMFSPTETKLIILTLLLQVSTVGGQQ